ncbi:MAG: carbohydrate porin [Acidobacteriaceae bacterium]|nr:carbohydrate porin [Acidobacteriaceae bacterium]MBV9780620.1 carbohydrate porin [Acidobacteriaceae bacterium]
MSCCGLRVASRVLWLVTVASFAVSLTTAQQQPPPDEHKPNSVTAPAAAASGDQPAFENWNLFYQATSIGEYHGTFHSPYQGPLSLVDVPERDVSLTTTLFFGARLSKNTQFYFDPEIAGGRGFSGVNGIADATNGELPRVASATPKPYIARLYVFHDFGFGDAMQHFDSDENQLAGDRPMTRYTIYVGRFSLTDFFDNNRYTHDPRTQFTGWSLMYNGAWDYPADTRGYTWGWVHEFHTENWSFRYGSAAEPKVANGLRFDRRIFRDRGDMFEAERRYEIRKHAGAIRILEFLLHTDSGTYAKALQVSEQTNTTPNVAAVHRPGTLKYGVGVSADQELTRDVGVFTRLGWNDGKTESFAFTAIDRMASGGVSIAGRSWKRKDDVLASAFIASGLSAVHATYLAHGGLDFLIGDGRLNYAPEYVWESYYSARLFSGFFTSFDAQRVANPAFNHDRGPVWAFCLRLHLELSKENFQRTTFRRMSATGF